jgi:NADPH2:quinone reductase
VEADMRAVRFDQYGDRDVLYVADVEQPEPAAGRVVVRVIATGINPGEAGIRGGAMHERFPSTFPSGQGSDFAGVIDAVGSEVNGLTAGDEVMGWSEERSSQADYVSVPAGQILAKPAGLDWLVAGSLYMPAATGTPAVDAVDPQPGETIAVSGAAGGIGSTVTQLLALRGAKVLAIASASNHDWLAAHGAVPVAYGENLKAELEAAAPEGIDAFIDLYGPAYVDLALELGVPVERIETIIAFQKAAEVGALTQGSMQGSKPEVLASVAELILAGKLDFPIAATFGIEQVRDAYELLEQRHSHGRVVLVMDPERARV